MSCTAGERCPFPILLKPLDISSNPARLTSDTIIRPPLLAPMPLVIFAYAIEETETGHAAPAQRPDKSNSRKNRGTRPILDSMIDISYIHDIIANFRIISIFSLLSVMGISRKDDGDAVGR
jgi:hypothetical protein